MQEEEVAPIPQVDESQDEAMNKQYQDLVKNIENVVVSRSFDSLHVLEGYGNCDD